MQRIPAFLARRGGLELSSFRFTLAVWAASRALFLVTGAIAAAFVKGAYPVGLPREPPGALNYWATWDGGWYASIAEHGYFATLWPSSANFFPVYPTLVRVGTHLDVGPALVGVSISLAACLAALWFLYDLTLDLYGERVARAACLALAFFPTSFYLNAVYTEAVYLAAAIGAVWAARTRGNFLLAGALGCVAAATRNIGVFLVLPIAYEWYRQRREVGFAAAAAIGLVPCGLLAYMFWLWRWSSHPLLFTTVVHQTWGRKFVNPLHTLDRAWEVAKDGAPLAAHPGRVLASYSANPSFNAMETYNFVFLVLLGALLVATLARAPIGLSSYAVLAAVTPLLAPAFFSPLASLPRYMLAAFPVFMVLGWLLSAHKLALLAWVCASGVFGVLLAVYFTTWRWVA